MLALGVLLSDDEHYPCRGHEGEGHDRENYDEERLGDIHLCFFLLRCCDRHTTAVERETVGPNRT